MTRINISPVTRIEGHAEVRIDLDDKGGVESAHFNVVEPLLNVWVSSPHGVGDGLSLT